MNSEFEKLVKECTARGDNIAFGSKDNDYNSGGIDIEDYYIYGVKSGMHILNQKMTRLFSLIESGKEPANESVEDNIVDLMNYVRYQYAVWKIYGRESDFGKIRQKHAERMLKLSIINNNKKE